MKNFSMIESNVTINERDSSGVIINQHRYKNTATSSFMINILSAITNGTSISIFDSIKLGEGRYSSEVKYNSYRSTSLVDPVADQSAPTQRAINQDQYVNDPSKGNYVLRSASFRSVFRAPATNINYWELGLYSGDLMMARLQLDDPIRIDPTSDIKSLDILWEIGFVINFI